MSNFIQLFGVVLYIGQGFETLIEGVSKSEAKKFLEDYKAGNPEANAEVVITNAEF